MRHAILTIAVLLLSSLASIHAGEQTLDAQTGISKTAKIELENGFRNPPDSVRPRTWWHWREGRISKEGITAELEAMKRIGVGGVTMFSASRYGETGPKILCLSPEWHERVRFAMQEAERLGLTFNFQNCAGWSGAGGPWITPDKAMQHVVSTTRLVQGGAMLKLEAPPSWPRSGSSFYRDIALLAFPTPLAYREAQTLSNPTVTSSFMTGDLSRLNAPVKRNAQVFEAPPTLVDAGKSAWVQFEFPSAVTCRAVTIAGTLTDKLPDEHRAVVLGSDDGREFREIVRLSTYLGSWHGEEEGVAHAIPQTTARFFRLSWEGPAKLALHYVRWASAPAIDSQVSKVGELGRTFISAPVLATEAGTAVPPEGIVDLTSQLDAQGNLVWTAPPGDSWTVTRIGTRDTGRVNMPAPAEATGLECDKFNPETVALHFENYARRIIEDAAQAKYRGLVGITFDSWEANSQNWSPVFREQFQKRRGYDVLRYLPAFAGFIIDDREVTDRFLRDVRQTMSELVSETFFGGMSKLAHKYGLQVHAEACGVGGAGTMVADPVQHYLHVDVPMNEFGDPLKEASSAAHLTGKPVVAIEGFTQGRVDWRSCPASLKAQGDTAFCAGVNQFVFHTCAHNPDLGKIYPGPAFGPYGLAFTRGQTWWEMGRPWITYLSRCQFLLQRGKAAADALYFYGEEPGGPIPKVFGGNRKNINDWPALPKGFDFDLLPAEILLTTLTVKDGKLTLPDGTAYSLLVLRDSDRMTPEAAAKISELVRNGARVMGPKPRRSVSLSGYPKCDNVVARIGDDVWGDCNGTTVTRHDFGKGRVYWGTALKETLAALPLAPDFTAGGASAAADVRFIHRRDGEAEIYFVANNRREIEKLDAGFRVKGKKPELWDPVTGKTREAIAFRRVGDRTFLPLQLDPSGSAFVIFRTPFSADATTPAPRPEAVFKKALTLTGPWNVAFAPGWGAPESVTFAALEDWSKRPEPGIRFYSGTAIYKLGFDWEGGANGAACLDLGAVEVIAQVKLNGVDCGIAWTPPYRVEIGKALRPGYNELEVRVANTWANRLMGEGRVNGATLHAWTTAHPFTKESQPFPAGLLGPVSLQVATE